MRGRPKKVDFKREGEQFGQNISFTSFCNDFATVMWLFEVK